MPPDTDPDGEACTLCELPASGPDAVEADGERFCCHGCREVHEALGDVEGVDAGEVRERAGEDDDPDPVPGDHERTFLELEGMYCSSCEAFIEAAAESMDGVSNAAASYVTETVRVDHDPEAVSEADIRETVSGLGYSAYAREDAVARRQADNWAFVRLGVGVLFGMMVMFQYVVLIYPTYFGGIYYDDRTAEFLAASMASTSGRYFFVVVAVLTTVVLVVTGRPILRGAYVGLRTGSPNMDLLVALAAVSAYVYSTLVVVTGGSHVYYDVTVAIVVVVTVGNHYESSVKRRATDLLSDLRSLQVEEATRVTDDGRETVGVDALGAGDRVLVRTGERVPVDGRVVDGEGVTDEAVVTGESLPVGKSAGDEVVGGSVLADGSLVVAVAEGATSSLDRIAALSWDFQSESGGVQKLADRLATVFVPLVATLAVAVGAGHLLLGGSPGAALLVGLTVLIVSCPCALGLATPLAVAAGVREALERNVVVFDETVFERLRGADTVVFDKTGTLTTGDLEVLSADVPDTSLSLSAELEARSSHPAATAVAEFRRPTADGGTVRERPDAEAPETDRVERFESHATGVSGVVDGTEVLVGHPDLFEECGWTLSEEVDDRAAEVRESGKLPVVVGTEGRAEGVVALGDTLREEWDDVVADLGERGADVVVLTGDEGAAAERFRDHGGVDRVFAGVPPEGKAETVGRLSAAGETVMVGDGTNDAPALARADLGVALGGGTAMAVDAADVAVVDDDLRSIGTLFDLASAAGRRLRENVGWAFCYNGVAIPLAATGLLNPLFAAVAMATSSLLVVANSSRSLLE